MESGIREDPALYLSVDVPWPFLFRGGLNMAKIDREIMTIEEYGTLPADGIFAMRG
jgi:hypothetical protein